MIGWEAALRRLGYSESRIRELKRERVERFAERADGGEQEHGGFLRGEVFGSLEEGFLLEVRCECSVDFLRELLAHVGATISRISRRVKGRS